MNINSELLKDCFVKSSHNSFLGSLQICGIAHSYHLKSCLERNYRMIELDIFSFFKSPVVGHGSNGCLGTTFIRLEKCLKVISEFGWKNTNDPLFVCIDFSTRNKKTLEKVSTLFQKYFSKQLLSGVDNKYLCDYTIGQLSNKLLIFSSSFFDEDYMFGSMNKQDSFYNIPHSQMKFPKSLIRNYPSNNIKSTNYNFIQAMGEGIHFISMNSGNEDEHLELYENLFYTKGIVPQRLFKNFQ